MKWQFTGGRGQDFHPALLNGHLFCVTLWLVFRRWMENKSENLGEKDDKRRTRQLLA